MYLTSKSNQWGLRTLGISLNWVGDFSLGGVEFDSEEELMSCVYESFCVEYEPEFNTFIFEEQCNDSLHASILTSLSSIPSPSHEAHPSVIVFFF